MSKEKRCLILKKNIIMKKIVTITDKNYLKLINNNNLDFKTGLTRFKYTSKSSYIWSFRFFEVKPGLYQTKSRLGHMKENWAFCGSLVTIMEYILNM